MEKIVRLTESDLTRIVKRVIKESDKKTTQAEVGELFDTVVNAMEDFIKKERTFESDDELIKKEFSKVSRQFKRMLGTLDPDPR